MPHRNDPPHVMAACPNHDRHSAAKQSHRLVSLFPVVLAQVSCGIRKTAEDLDRIFKVDTALAKRGFPFGGIILDQHRKRASEINWRNAAQASMTEQGWQAAGLSRIRS
jgi:hypothetical protein